MMLKVETTDFFLLNDESAKRKEQADVARQDLDTIREERNALSSDYFNLTCIIYYKSR
jgi:hypothetical protein